MLLNRRLEETSCPVPLPDLYFDPFSYPVASIVSSAGGIFKFYCLSSQSQTTGFLEETEEKRV